MKKQAKFLYWPAGAMEFCRLYAWAYYSGLTILQQPFPFTEAIIAFALAAFLTHFTLGKGLRIIRIWGLHILGFGLVGLRVLYVHYPNPFLFVDFRWLADWLHKPKTFWEWCACFFVLLWCFLFWWSGRCLRRRVLTRQKMKTRFDLGLSAFFLLFTVKLIAGVKGAALPKEAVTMALVFPFLFLSLTVMGRLHERQAAHKNFRTGYRSLAVILGFGLAILLYAIGGMVFLYPYLLICAERGYDLMRTGANVLTPVLANLLRFMFLGGRRRGGPVDASQDKPSLGLPDHPPESSSWIQAIEEFLLWVVLGLLTLTLLLVLGFIVRHWLLPWFIRLFARTASVSKERPAFKERPYWAKLLRFLRLHLKRIEDWAKGHTRAVQVYGALLRWGCLSRVRRMVTETPREYGRRLGQHFPKLEQEISLIIAAYHKEVYQESRIDQPQWWILRRAWRRLCSPLQWPLRIRNWI